MKNKVDLARPKLKPAGKNTNGFPKKGCPVCESERLYGPSSTPRRGWGKWTCIQCGKTFCYSAIDNLYVNKDGTSIEQQEVQESE